MTRWRAVIVFVGSVALPAPTHAQEQPAETSRSPYLDEQSGLALDGAIARALEREPKLQAVRTEGAVAQGQREQAGLRPSPTFSFERREEPSGTDNLTTLGLEWPLDLFRRDGRVQTADRAVVAATFGVSDRERVLAADVRMQYGATTAAVRELAVTDEIVVAMRRQLDAVRARVDVGATPPLERDLLDVELRRLEASRALVVGRADVAVLQLKQLLGMAPADWLVLRQSLESLVVSLGASAVDARVDAVESRPDVREADANVTVADARIDLARRDGRLDVSVYGTFMRMDSGFPQLGISSAGDLERVRGRFSYVAGGARVTLPVFNRNQGQIAAMQAERAGAEARRNAATLAARTEIATARARDVQAQRAVGVYAGDVRRLARQNLDVVRQTFDLGRSTVFDVLAEQRRYLEIEQAYTATLREAWEARAALKRALGDTK